MSFIPLLSIIRRNDCLSSLFTKYKHRWHPSILLPLLICNLRLSLSLAVQSSDVAHFTADASISAVHCIPILAHYFFFPSFSLPPVPPFLSFPPCFDFFSFFSTFPRPLPLTYPFNLCSSRPISSIYPLFSWSFSYPSSPFPSLKFLWSYSSSL